MQWNLKRATRFVGSVWSHGPSLDCSFPNASWPASLCFSLWTQLVLEISKNDSIGVGWEKGADMTCCGPPQGQFFHSYLTPFLPLSSPVEPASSSLRCPLRCSWRKSWCWTESKFSIFQFWLRFQLLTTTETGHSICCEGFAHRCSAPGRGVSCRTWSKS